MKGTYIIYGDNLYDSSVGENQKIIAQQKFFIRNGLNCSYTKLDETKESLISKILYRLPFTNVNPIWKFHKELGENDFIYMRRPHTLSYYMYKTLKKVKKSNNNIKIIMEIPTFPYDKELLYRAKGKFLNYPLYIKDLFWRNKIKKVIDYITTPSVVDSNIWGISTIEIGNGVEMERYQIKKTTKSNDINLLAVAYFKEWHGYERILKALSIYYSGDAKRKVYLHMVGDGTELEEYKSIVDKLNLFKYVKFYGRKKQHELEEIYDMCDIGLCSFGGYKKDLFLSKELKSREYLAKGMPIVTGCTLDICQNGFKYCLEFPNDSSEVDIRQIIEFYDTLLEKSSKEQLAKDIRAFADRYISIDVAMQPILNVIL